MVAKVARAQAKATDGVRGCLVQTLMAAILMMVSIRMFFPAMVPFPAVVPMSLAMMVHMLLLEYPNTCPSFEVE